MVNDSDPDEVIMKVEEFMEKYVDIEGGALDLAVGNIDDDTVCSPDVTCEEQCAVLTPLVGSAD